MEQQNTELMTQLHSETAMIDWQDLQRFFAKGVVIVVDPALNLVEVASWFAQDSTEKLTPLFDSNQVSKASDEQAKTWFKENKELWSVVVSPFVLVQDKPAPKQN